MSCQKKRQLISMDLFVTEKDPWQRWAALDHKDTAGGAGALIVLYQYEKQ